MHPAPAKVHCEEVFKQANLARDEKYDYRGDIYEQEHTSLVRVQY